MFQSTRPAWGATIVCVVVPPCNLVSIHAPRVGRDDFRLCSFNTFNVSIHAPRVGRDLGNIFGDTQPTVFQSTRPAWGATCLHRWRRAFPVVSIHAPRVGRDVVVYSFAWR